MFSIGQSFEKSSLPVADRLPRSVALQLPGFCRLFRVEQERGEIDCSLLHSLKRSLLVKVQAGVE